MCICDCTGHGTPGALLTMLVVSALDAVVKESNCTDTAHVFVCNGTEIEDIKGQKLRVGSGKISSREDVKMVVLHADENNKYYVVSDGLFDQIGETTRSPFGYKPFKKIILENHDNCLADIFEKFGMNLKRTEAKNVEEMMLRWLGLERNKDGGNTI